MTKATYTRTMNTLISRGMLPEAQRLAKKFVAGNKK